MTIQQLLIWAHVIPALITANIMTADQVTPLLKSFHPSLSDAELTDLAGLISAKTSQVIK